MPHEWNNKIVVTKDELVPNWFSSTNTLYSLIQRYKLKPYGIKVLQRGGNGRVMLIDFDSLDTPIQHGIGDPRLVNHVLEPYDNSYLAMEYQDRYIINASVLKAAIALRAVIEKDRKKKGVNTTGITAILCEHVKTFNKTLQVKHKGDQHNIPESEKRFKQLLKDFERGGYKNLISGKHGNDNSRKVFDETLGLLKSLFVSDTAKPSPTEVHRRYMDFLSGKKEIVNNLTGEVYNPADFKKLSDSTVKNYLTSWDVAVSTSLIRLGDRQKQMGKYKPYVSFDKPVYAGSLISVDDRQPPFVMVGGKRIWLYVAVDVASGAYICVVYGKTKEGLILKFYRQLVRNIAQWGLCMPDGLECESSLNSQFVNTFLAEGAMFQNVKIEPNNARGKVIENFNRQMRYGIEKYEENFNSRPFAVDESNQAGTHKVKYMLFDDIAKMCNENYEDWNDFKHPLHPDLSRWDMYKEMQHPDLKPINYNAILPHIGYKTPTSCKLGFIQFNGRQHVLGENGNVALGDRLISLMQRVEGRDVTVYWLDDNEGNILKALVFIDTQLICEAIPKPTFNRATNELKDKDFDSQKIMFSYIKTIEAYGLRGKKAIERVTVIDNSPAPKKGFIMPGQYKPATAINGWHHADELPETNDSVEYEFIQPEKTYTKPLKERLNSN